MEREGTATTRPLAQSYIIKRPRLTKLLDESEARIIMLVAPAGYGKTTLAREWLKDWRGPTAWFSTSAASADVAALAIGIADELDTAQGDTERPTASRLAALTPVQQRPDALARALVRGRAEWQPRLVLAIDDYHHLSSNPPAEDFVGMLVQLLPVTFVITSRSRPNWLAPRFSVYGEAFELGVNDLAMTDEEAERVLRPSMRLHAKNSIGLAHGWPAIIGLAAHTETEDLPNVIPARLYEFLAEDLVGTAPASVQKALVVLAITGVSELPTALDLLGAGAAPDIDEAERRGLLTFSDTNHFMLHPLLSDFLVARLGRDTEELSALVDELVPVLIASRRWNECLAVAEAVPGQHFPLEEVLQSALADLLSEGRVTTVTRWTQLARCARLDSPIVDLAESEIALLEGDYEKALALGPRAARGLAVTELRTRAQLVAAQAAHLTDRRATAREWFRSAENTAPSNDMRAEAIWGQFLVTYEDESESLEDALSRYIAATDGSIDHELRSAQGQLLVDIAEGNAAAALSHSFRGVALASVTAEPFKRLALLSLHAWVLAWAGRYGDALAASERAQTEAELTDFDFALMHIQLTKATALVGLRRFSSAQQILSGLRRRLRDDPNRWALSNLHIAEAKLQIGVGDLKQAQECLGVAPAGSYISQRAEHDGYRGLIAAAQGSDIEAEDWARQLTTVTTHVDRLSFPALIRAVIAARKGTSAVTASEQFEVALGNGQNDAIVTACRACPELVAQLFQTSHRDTLAALLSESRDSALASAAGVRLPRSAQQKDGLSPRELEVYELIVQGRTNREIAQTLFIAESTTKVHVRHILEKLGVRSRVDAVRAWRLDAQ